jgi:hypothetical protein
MQSEDFLSSRKEYRQTETIQKDGARVNCNPLQVMVSWNLTACAASEKIPNTAMKTSCPFAQNKRERDMSYNRVSGEPPHSQKRDGKAEEKKLGPLD